MQRKTVKHPEAAAQWKDAFRNSSMKIGFTLCLSKAMLEMLCAVADDVTWDRGIYRLGCHVPENWIASQNSLVKRGLIERKSQDEISGHKHRLDETFHEWNCYRLTPAGECVVGLLKIAGMFIESDAAINKKARSRRA